jgi:hypothetical protein
MFIVPIVELIFTALPRVKGQGQTFKKVKKVHGVATSYFVLNPTSPTQKDVEFAPKLKKSLKIP